MSPYDEATFALAIYLMIATSIGAVIGAIGAAIMAHSKYSRIEQETWNKARLYYTQNEKPADAHI